MQEVVPQLTGTIVEALTSMGYGQPLSVPVKARKDCRPNECWVNVPRVVESECGEAVPGRIVWMEVSNRWLHLEAHCVWRTPSGTLIDPTPKVDRETDIIFVAEPLVWEERSIPSRYHVFSDDPVVREFCELAVKWQEVLCRRPPGQEIPLHTLTPEEKDLFRRKAANEMRMAPELMASLMAMNSGEILQSGQRVGRNEPCPCGSGKKFKKCCLR